MALIAEFNHLGAGGSQIDPTTVTCDWNWFSSEVGPVLELRTGGSSERKLPGKHSQKPRSIAGPPSYFSAFSTTPSRAC